MALLVATCIRCAAAGPWPALEDPIFAHFDAESELGGSAATAFAQDRDGFVWIGTEGGLARFDGYHVRRYSPDPAIAGALPNGVIEVLFVDARGRLWIGTQSGGLVQYDRQNDRFVRYSLGRATPRSQSVHTLADDGSGGLWIGTGDGLEHLAADARTIAPVQWRVSQFDPHARRDIIALLRDRRGTLWIGTHDGLYRKAPRSKAFDSFDLPGHPTIWSLLEDHRGNIWIGTTTSGAYRFDPSSGTARVIRTTDDGPKLETEAVSSMAEVRDGEVWLATYAEGIVAVDAASLRTHRIRHDPRLPTSLAADSVFTLATDDARQVWVFTSAGICRYDPQTAIGTLFGGTGRANRLAGTNIQSVAETADGRLWLGASDNGGDTIDPGRATFTRVRAGLPADGQIATIAQFDGAVFIGTSAGLFRADPSGRSVHRVVVPGRGATAPVAALYASRGVLWLGSDGLWGLRVNNTGRPRVFAHLAAAVLHDSDVEAIVGDRGGRAIWLATHGGLVRFDTSTHAVERIEADPTDPTSLAANALSSLVVDRRGRLWVGTIGGGIAVLEDPESSGRRHFRRIGTTQGLPHFNIDALVEDDRGNIWASTDNGLAVIDGPSFAVRPLGRAEGVAILNYWVHSAVRTHRGEVVFGGGGGITVVRPDRLRPWAYRAPVVVTDVLVGDERVSVPQPGESGDATLTIPASANRVSVQFSALDNTAPARNRYAYRLDGYDKAWMHVDADHRVATYTNLPPGTYRLRLRGSNRDGVWTVPDTVLPIEVLPAWYQTWWFVAFEGVGAIGIVTVAVHIRTRYLRAHERVLACEVERRTLQLMESRRQLEALVYCDLLTGLPNRRMFNEEFGKRAGAVSHAGDGFTLLLIDLDRFKHINDTFGHDAGDAVLVEAGKRFKSAVRDTDCVVRLGGDEFAIVISDCTTAEIEEICNRLVAAFAAPIAFNDALLATSPSIGIALFPRDGDTQDAVYKAADLALYEAKRAGRNTWRWHGQPV